MKYWNKFTKTAYTNFFEWFVSFRDRQERFESRQTIRSFKNDFDGRSHKKDPSNISKQLKTNYVNASKEMNKNFTIFTIFYGIWTKERSFFDLRLTR